MPASLGPSIAAYGGKYFILYSFNRRQPFGLRPAGINIRAAG